MSGPLGYVRQTPAILEDSMDWFIMKHYRARLGIDGCSPNRMYQFTHANLYILPVSDSPHCPRLGSTGITTSRSQPSHMMSSLSLMALRAGCSHLRERGAAGQLASHQWMAWQPSCLSNESQLHCLASLQSLCLCLLFVF